MPVRIASWNVNGIRARLRHGHLTAFLAVHLDIDILCLQETKAEESQVKLPQAIQDRFPYRYWQSTRGTTQRKGLSGTAIWSSVKPVQEVLPPPFDEEGRITVVEFPDFYVSSVYAPTTSGGPARLAFRTGEWHAQFKGMLDLLGESKPSVVTGDLNVGFADQDVYDPHQMRGRSGFLDVERTQFAEYLVTYQDAFRALHPDQKRAFTAWDSRLGPADGTRLDYFLLSGLGEPFDLIQCDRMPDIHGSDHCPSYIELAMRSKSV